MNAPILLFPGSRRSGAQPRSQPESSYPLVADVSNYSGRISDAQVEAMVAAGVAGVIVRVDTADPERIAIMQGQLAVLRSHDMPVGGYVFPDYEQRPADFLATLFSLAGELRSLWVDLEPVDGEMPCTFAVFKWWMSQAALAMPSITTLGIYTSAWVIAQLPAWKALPFPLWLASYTYQPPVSLAIDVGGYSEAAGIQYSDAGDIAGVLCDLSFFDPAAIG